MAGVSSTEEVQGGFGWVGLWLLLRPTVSVAFSFISGQGFCQGLTTVLLSWRKPR